MIDARVGLTQVSSAVAPDCEQRFRQRGMPRVALALESLFERERDGRGEGLARHVGQLSRQAVRSGVLDVQAHAAILPRRKQRLPGFLSRVVPPRGRLPPSALLDGIAPELRACMQGKSCFNFTTVDASSRPRQLPSRVTSKRRDATTDAETPARSGIGAVRASRGVGYDDGRCTTAQSRDPRSLVKSIYKTRSLTEKTYRRIERAILRHELEPGEPLVINELAGRLGVSRTPVKEALLLLERSGLVEAEEGRMHVANLSLDDLEEVFEVRASIELYAIGKIAHAGEVTRQLANVYDSLQAYRSPAGTEDAQRASELDLKFHRALVASAGNRRMLTIWDQMATELQRFWSDGVGNLSRIASDVDECVSIVDAIRNHDADAASALLVRHLDQTKRALMSWRDQQHARTEGASVAS